MRNIRGISFWGNFFAPEFANFYILLFRLYRLEKELLLLLLLLLYILKKEERFVKRRFENRYFRYKLFVIAFSISTFMILDLFAHNK